MKKVFYKFPKGIVSVRCRFLAKMSVAYLIPFNLLNMMIKDACHLAKYDKYYKFVYNKGFKKYEIRWEFFPSYEKTFELVSDCLYFKKEILHARQTFYQSHTHHHLCFGMDKVMNKNN